MCQGQVFQAGNIRFSSRCLKRHLRRSGSLSPEPILQASRDGYRTLPLQMQEGTTQGAGTKTGESQKKDTMRRLLSSRAALRSKLQQRRVLQSRKHQPKALQLQNRQQYPRQNQSPCRKFLRPQNQQARGGRGSTRVHMGHSRRDA